MRIAFMHLWLTTADQSTLTHAMASSVGSRAGDVVICYVLIPGGACRRSDLTHKRKQGAPTFIHVTLPCYLPLTISYARMPNATTMALQPMMLQTVNVSTASPKTMSDIDTSTIESRLPTEVTMGPHRPMRT